MAYMILGIAVGCWMYAFVNHRYNKKPWIDSRYVFVAGSIAIIAGVLLLF